jgi:hypothetical protein
MAPLGESVSVTEIAPEAANLHDEVAKISAKLAAARDLREGLGRLLNLPWPASNDAILDEVRRLRTRAAGLANDQVVPSSAGIPAQLNGLQEQYNRLDDQYCRLVRSLRAKGVLE